jgi:hypothetical protein
MLILNRRDCKYRKPLKAPRREETIVIPPTAGGLTILARCSIGQSCIEVAYGMAVLLDTVAPWTNGGYFGGHMGVFFRTGESRQFETCDSIQVGSHPDLTCYNPGIVSQITKSPE